MVFVDLSRFEEAMLVCNKMLSRFHNVAEPTLREPIARAPFAKAHAFGHRMQFQPKIFCWPAPIPPRRMTRYCWNKSPRRLLTKKPCLVAKAGYLEAIAALGAGKARRQTQTL